MADSAMGFLFTRPEFAPGDGWRVAVLIAASSSFYAAGVVLNDVHDYRTDLEERPDRPLPSGRVPLSVARWLGWELLVIGVAMSWTAAALSGTARPGLVGLALAACVVLYNGLLKPTILGPIAMGACRFSNVLLGMSVAVGPWRDEHWLVAVAIGTYVVGVAWFARTEAEHSGRLHLSLATAVILSGFGILSFLPDMTEETIDWLLSHPERWTLLMLVLGAVIGYRCLRAVIDPTPYRVQTAVTVCILSLVILDAAACFVVRGLFGAVLVLVLLIPAVVLGRWIYST
jgi:4-hydroxybenzoate polyprenyltransferase